VAAMQAHNLDLRGPADFLDNASAYTDNVIA